MGKTITIAIDGHSSTGKSSMAKQLASHFGFYYVDSGAMYRAATYHAMELGLLDKDVPLEDRPEDVQTLLSNLHIDFKLGSAGDNRTYLNGVDVESEIRAMKVSERVSDVAKISAVRAELVEQQRAISKGKNVVMDGRDIGTVVFPDAELKIFMTASPDVRAKRRWTELKEKGRDVSLGEVQKNLEERDRIDSSREDSPLVQAEDAILLDNSNLSREEQFELVKGWIQERL